MSLMLLARWLRLWNGAKGKGRWSRSPTTPRLECLERRDNPVVGALAVPLPVLPGAGFDGVVFLQNPNPFTGSLIYTGTHILTAAHTIVGFPAGRVSFYLDRVPSPIQFDIHAGEAFQFSHPQYSALRTGYDLAIIPLTDQEPGYRDVPTRLVVAPFGAERYNLYRGSAEVGSRVVRPENETTRSRCDW